jgi:hypothetical protein
MAFADQLPMEPPHDSGQSVTGAYEGWFPNKDGTFSLLFGYYNRNQKQELEIPVGPNNRIEPGGPDRGQPTHFLAGRQFGVFTITVPKDFGEKKLTWTLTANGKTTVIPGSLNVLWEVSPFVEAGGNTPPFISFEEDGVGVNGPRGQSKTLAAGVSAPVPLTVWVADDAKARPGLPRPRTPPVVVSWSKFRGPGAVTFDHDRPAVEKVEPKSTPPPAFAGKATATATFSEPGDYILRVLATDWSPGGGFQCCWTNAQVKVTVK